MKLLHPSFCCERGVSAVADIRADWRIAVYDVCRVLGGSFVAYPVAQLASRTAALSTAWLGLVLIRNGFLYTEILDCLVLLLSVCGVNGVNAFITLPLRFDSGKMGRVAQGSFRS